MTRVFNAAEKNVFSDPPKPITVPAATTTDVLADERNTRTEVAARFIQNVGSNSCFYCFNGDASPVSYNGILDAKGQLNCSDTTERVSVYSTAGTTIAVTIKRRYDRTHSN